MAIRVLDVAKYFLSKSIPNSEQAITHLKLQKLIYYAQAWHLAFTDEPLFNDKIEAWVHGPVCPVLYYEYRDFGFDEIPKPKEAVFIPDSSKKIIDAVWEIYGSLSGPDLEDRTHKEEPWIDSRGHLPEFARSNNDIHHEDIKRYFKQLLRDK